MFMLEKYGMIIVYIQAYLMLSLVFLLIVLLILQVMSIMFRMTESVPTETIDAIIGRLNVNVGPTIRILQNEMP